MPCLVDVAERAGVVAADADQAGDRTGEHDRPAVALIDQPWLRDLHGVVHSGQVDVDDVAPTVHSALHRRDTGIGDDDVHAAELVDSGLQRRRQARLIANIGLPRDDPRAGVLDQFDGLREVLGRRQRVRDRGDLLTDVDRDDVGALGGQPHGFGAALTAGGAGDERDLALQRAH